jgi:MraZ protein
MQCFRGHFEHALDDKGRVAIPARFREVLSALQETHLVVTRPIPEAGRSWLDCYPESIWRQLEKKLLGGSRLDPTIRRIRRVLVENAFECVPDGQGRINIPTKLRDYASLQRDLVFTGEIDMFRLWGKEMWERSASDDEEFVIENPGLIRNLGI